MHVPDQILYPAHHVVLPNFIFVYSFHLYRLHSEELGGPPLKKLKQEVIVYGML